MWIASQSSLFSDNVKESTQGMCSEAYRGLGRLCGRQCSTLDSDTLLNSHGS